MRIEKKRIDELIPAEYNPRKDLQPGDPEYEKLKTSIMEYDLVEPLIWNERTGRLVGGHQRLKVLKELGYEEVEVSVVDLPEEKEKAMNVALNKIQGDWDKAKLKDLLLELDNGDFDVTLTGFDMDEIEKLMTEVGEIPKESKYTDKIVAPVYEPKGEKPSISDLLDTTKADELMKLIDESQVSEEEKKFLKLAATRMIVFDYHNIAEYYAHADPEMQELMEKLALVIIDYQKAIQGGFVDFVTEVMDAQGG